MSEGREGEREKGARDGEMDRRREGEGEIGRERREGETYRESVYFGIV